jgi:EpsI family protein
MMKIGRSQILALLMFLTAACAVLLTPRQASEPSIKIDKLEFQVPKAVGDWNAVEGGAALIVNPETEKKINTLYSDTLSRTYVNSKGDRIMLSLAYGQNQSRELQIHKPEVCYVAQGFQIGHMTKINILSQSINIPAMRLTAKLDRRIEPITYWIRSGDDLVSGWYEQNKSRILAGLRGEINDGMLVRVSSISSDEINAYLTQEIFIQDLLKAMDPKYHHMFIGNRAKNWQ